jgi:hypothetical protein
MHPLLTQIEAKKNMKVLATFDNGVSKIVDVKQYVKLFEPFEKLKDEALFNKVRVDYKGHAAVWTDDIDLDASDLWEYGKTV